MSDEKLKACTFCKKSLPISFFNKNKKKKDGLQTQCRECGKKKSVAYYNSNKEIHKKATAKRNKNTRIATKQYVYDFLKNRGCIDCGESDPCCLDFDHQRDKKENVSRIANGGYSLATVILEIDKCEIRCANCHRKKTAKDFNWYKSINTEP